MTAAEAERLEWCQVRDGKVHAAIWRSEGGGYLTTYTTVEPKNAKQPEKVVCMAQSWVSLADLVPYDDREKLAKKLKIKVCKVCEEE